jgi:hypothetical protein
MPTFDVPNPPAAVLDGATPQVTTDSPTERAWYPAVLVPVD